MAYSQRILDIMTTGSSMARLFYSPSIMSLLEQPIRTEDVFLPWKPERPSGYSQSHWRKIQKERWKRAAQRPRTISGRRAFLEQYSCSFDHSVDAAKYAFMVADHMKRRLNEQIDNVLIGTTANTVITDDVPSELKLADLEKVMRSMPKRPKFDLHGSSMIGRPYELPEVDKALAKVLGCEGRRVLVVPKDQLQHWFTQLVAAGADVRVEPPVKAAATQTSVPASPGTPRTDSTPRCTPSEAPRLPRGYDP